MKWNVTPEKEDSYCVPKERQLLCKSLFLKVMAILNLANYLKNKDN